MDLFKLTYFYIFDDKTWILMYIRNMPCVRGVYAFVLSVIDYLCQNIQAIERAINEILFCVDCNTLMILTT